MQEPILYIDFKPTFSIEELAGKLASVRGDLVAATKDCWKLSTAAHAVLCESLPGDMDAEALAHRAKACAIPLMRPRPIDEAISSAGGVRWSELDENLMLRKIPEVYVAGEMIDWEAPTGGYLMQGCFATGSLVARAALHD